MAGKKTLLTAALCLCFTATQAQNVWDRLFIDEHRLDTADTRVLKVRVDATGFFHDNEYSSKMTDGYTLPGALLSPRLTYNPIDEIHIELGVHALCFNGANKYPNYAYHDIGMWKGDQYQSGFHLLPWIRLQAQLKGVNIILGDLYGGQNHRLIEPMWNSETNLSQDPEMGVQVKWDSRHIQMDTWLNWQSYIFKLERHQEAFTVGSVWRVLFGDHSKQKGLKWSLPVQLLIQHRGGEQDDKSLNLGVQTLCNASVGAAVRGRIWGAELNVLGSYQQSGHLWPFQSGMALHAGGDVRLWDQMAVKAGYFGAPKQFANLYGSPFFSTVSLQDNTAMDGMHTVYAKVSWDKTWAKAYTLGAALDLYQSWYKHPEGSRSELNFDFGIYLRVCPEFVIKSWKKK